MTNTKFQSQISASDMKICRCLFYLSLALLGFFNDLPMFAGSATFRSPSTWFLLLIPLTFAVLSSRKIPLKIAMEYQLSIVLLIWVVVSFVANFCTIASLGSQETDGLTLFSKGIIILLLSYVSAIISGSSLARTPLFLMKTRKWLTISFLIVAPYALLEVIYYVFSVEWAREVRNFLDFFVHDRREALYPEFRVRGLAFEASYFGVYCSVIFPWLFSYFFYKRIRMVILIPFSALFFTFLILSQSRTAYVTILTELFIYIIMLYWYAPSMRKKITILLGITAAGAIVFYGSMLKNSIILNTLLLLFDTGYGSNITRIASQHAAMLLAFDNPIFGVGIGLSGAHIPNYYPSYAWASSDMVSWASESARSLSSPAFGLLAQIASELGLIGLVIFLINGGYWLIRIVSQINLRSRIFGSPDYLGISLLVSAVGVIIASFGLQGYTFPGYWILLSLTYAYINKKVTL